MSRNMSAIVVNLGLAGIVALASAGVVLAGTTAQISATVTAQNVSITLTSDGSVAYGTQSLSNTPDTTTGTYGVDDTQTVQNNGNVAEDFTIQGANSTNWSLAATAGANQYGYKFCTTTCDTTPSWTSMNNATGVSLSTSVGAGSSKDVDFQLLMPTSDSSGYAEQSFNVTITAAAS